MEFNFKRLFSLVVAFVMVLSMIPFDGLQVFAAGETQNESNTADISYLPTTAQTAINKATEVRAAANAAIASGNAKTYLNSLSACPMCGQTGATWSVLTVATGVWASDGNARHVILDANTPAQTGGNIVSNGTNISKLCIMLDNCDLTAAGGFLRNVAGTSDNNVTNIMGNGKVHSTYTYGLIRANKSGTVFNVYGGTYTLAKPTSYSNPVINIVAGATVNIYDGVVIGPAQKSTTNTYNSSIYGTLNMYGGTIQNGYTTNSYQSGNIYVREGGTFNMYGGLVTGGRAVHGGNVYVCPGSTALIYGTIENGTAVGKKTTDTYRIANRDTL